MRPRVAWGLVALPVIAATVIFVPGAVDTGNDSGEPGNAVGKKVYIAFRGKCHTLKAAGSQAKHVVTARAAGGTKGEYDSKLSR